MTSSRLLSKLVAACMCVSADAAIGAENECINCHENPAFYSEYPKLHNYFQQWLGSPHQQAGVACDDCHSGDPDESSVAGAHAGVLPMNATDSTLHYLRQPDTCGQCHRSNRNQFVQSKHFTALMGQRAAPTCTTCHPAMSRRPELRSIVLNACRNCHGEGNSENLPLIADQAERVFQQLNIAGGLLGWTRIHYETLGWPDQSMELVTDLEQRHELIIDGVHQFNIGETEADVAHLLGDLREMFDAAYQASKQRENPIN